MCEFVAIIYGLHGAVKWKYVRSNINGMTDVERGSGRVIVYIVGTHVRRDTSGLTTGCTKVRYA